MPRKLNDWLSSYIDYTINQESPEQFHLWCGVSTIAAALGRKCWVDRGYYFTFPNHYIILVSASALCKKTTAAMIAIEMYNRVFKEAPAVAKKVTLEKLMLNLGQLCKATGNASIFLFNDELSTLIGRTGHSELMDFLTGVYGCPNNWINETKNKGVDILRNLFINFLGATTPKDLAAMPSTMIDGGFAGRSIFVYSDNPRPPIPDPKALFTDKTTGLREDLIHDLNEIVNIHGEYILTKSASDLFATIYAENYHNKDVDFRLNPYQGRKGEHLIKLAMVVAASRRDELVIDERDIKIAGAFLKKIEGVMVDTFTHVAYSSSASSKHVEKFLQLLRKSGGEITHSKALNKLYHYVNADEMKSLVNTLEESGIINVDITGKLRVYKLTKKGAKEHEATTVQSNS